MAYCDYMHCKVCGAKAFYDAEIDWDYQNTDIDKNGVVTLCKECLKTHEIIVRASELAHAEQEKKK